MHLLQLLLASYLTLPTFALPPQSQSPLVQPSDTQTDSRSHDNNLDTSPARENAPRIFNALHSSLRQWGSSLKHNGMSFFPAKIPAHTRLYHGTHTDQPVPGMEWLAFEMEHAEIFARQRGFRRPGGGPPGRRPGRPEHPGPPGDSPSIPSGPLDRTAPPNLGHLDSYDEKSHAFPPLPGDLPRGHLHIYETKRELTRVLYLDGMAAAKSSVGTLDTQDLILRNSTSEANDLQRAMDMCSLGAEWNIEGFIRMEAGFELILCNFTNGLNFISAFQRPSPEAPEAIQDRIQHFEYLRGVTKRYQGITAGRIEIDYSRMVSAYFLPLNLTNVEKPDKGLPRLPADDVEGLELLRSNLHSMVSAEGSETPRIDWQGVVDMIVTRYSDRLQYLISTEATQALMLSELNFLLSAYIDFKTPNTSSALELCLKHYLKSIIPSTKADHFIYKAIHAVSENICSTLFSVRQTLINAEIDDLSSSSAKEKAKAEIRKLTTFLDWSTWLECGKCPYDKICFVPMWPFGSPEDHEHPSCIGIDDLGTRFGYWDFI